MFLLYLIIIVIFLLDISNVINLFSNNIIDLSTSNYTPDIPNGNSTTQPTDPVRYWPSGVPQNVSIVGVGLATFMALSKLSNCSPRLRVLGALGAAGASATSVVYQTAIENPVGFNRFMFGANTRLKTGHWPSLEEISNSVPSKQLDEFVKSEIAKANKDLAIVDKIVEEVQKRIDNGSNFLPDDSTDISNNLLDFFLIWFHLC